MEQKILKNLIRENLNSHLAHLREPRNPYAHAELHEQVRAYLRRHLEAHGRMVAEQEVPSEEHGKGVNLLGEPVDGSVEPAFLLVAHYDTVTDSPGADDNGSAVAVALEVGRLCPHIALLFPDLEEVGLLGARHFVAQNRWTQTPAVVLESVGYFSEQPDSQKFPPVLPLAFPEVYRQLKDRDFRGDFLTLLNLPTDRLYAQRLEQLLGAAGIRLEVPTQLLTAPGGEALKDFGRSDHLAFWEAGRPCLMLTDSANFRNPHYHQPSDTAETLNFSKMTQLVECLVQFFDN